MSSTDPSLNNFERVAELISKAEALIFTAGAGMGVDSGLPDFRGDRGFWKAYPALKGHSFADMANPRWFLTQPDRAWGFYGHRLNLYRQTQPHEGFSLMLKWAKETPYFIYTSNVDGAFQRAGFDDRSIVECHGSIHYLQTLDGSGAPRSADPFTIQVDEEHLRAHEPLPRDDQGALLRPNILMFGDWGWDHQRTQDQENRFDRFLTSVQLDRVVVIEVGAGTAIPSVRMMGSSLSAQGASLVRINPREWRDAEYPISLGGLDGLSRIDEAITQRSP
jgi:NAD-dependent SIR2 family protein deacetylase